MSAPLYTFMKCKEANLHLCCYNPKLSRIMKLKDAILCALDEMQLGPPNWGSNFHVNGRRKKTKEPPLIDSSVICCRTRQRSDQQLTHRTFACIELQADPLWQATSGLLLEHKRKNNPIHIISHIIHNRFEVYLAVDYTCFTTKCLRHLTLNWLLINLSQLSGNYRDNLMCRLNNLKFYQTKWNYAFCLIFVTKKVPCLLNTNGFVFVINKLSFLWDAN